MAGVAVAPTEVVTELPFSLPPGFRFHPTDQELVDCFLRRKVLGHGGLHIDIIPEVDLYRFEPDELPDKSFSPSRDDPGAKVEWYLFAPRARKYPNGLRMKRATQAGFWKSTGKDRPVTHHHAVIGMKKMLVFHLGRAPGSMRTDWVMHEYRLHEDMTPMQHTYALCRLYKKNTTTMSPGVPTVVAATDEGASMQFVPSGADDDNEQFNIDDFFADEDMEQFNVGDFFAGEDIEQFNVDNLFAP